ncbi:helix-turn-helix domain-containing protein [Mangrovibacterium diazotrophicum]|uniref:AraC-like DNA-binding protein n=1 Tax=Mangrovibacterium diazotrophicum TaxID=1261403 RepID=A0A419W5X7_9BACT|nr:helix-turn-helix domain-containing protein [Mangrovibacterium diazotrophicum]RKD90868.1 AraC-like DNA-binding protein [Mangrovibacterium diazotrophicum]
MESTVYYLGISQSLFSAIFILFRKRLKLADIMLASWFFYLTALFVFNIVKLKAGYHEDLWPISLILYIGFPISLFMYSKYITKDYEHFQRKDYLFHLPQIVVFLAILLAYDFGIDSIGSFGDYFNSLRGLKYSTGIFFHICLVFYSIGAYYKIHKYKKQIGNAYSFESQSINLSWLRFVVISFFVVFNFIIVVSAFKTIDSAFRNVEMFRSGALLVFVYILSFFGLKQQQLITGEDSISLNENLEHTESSSDRYKKSGLKDQKAEEYLNLLIEYMNQHKAWKDHELTVAKLSDATGIPKYYISQVLNENLQKNFYTFVNEYRVECAKNMIVSPKYKDWSIVAISFECGFNSKAAFNNFFKKYTEMTPSEYKKSVIGS